MANEFLKVNKDLFKLGLNPIEILVYAQIIEFDTNTGDCFMSDKAFAENFGVSEKTVQRALANLEGKNLIIRNTKNIKNGKERHIRLVNGQNDSCSSTRDKLTLVQGTNCPLPNGQNVLIKDNTLKDNIIKDNIVAALAAPPESAGASPASFKSKREKAIESSFNF